MPFVPNLWPGETVACIASGPSLTADDCAYVRGKVRVIAINDGWRLAPWADVLFADRAWWRHYRGRPEFTGLRYALGSRSGKSNPIRECPDVTVLKNAGFRGLSTDAKGLMCGLNSGYAAVNLAVHLGASRIILLGYNMGIPPGTDKLHFFGEHPQGLKNEPWAYAGFRRAFLTMVEPLKALGIEVVNCTPNTSLEAFPVADLREVLPIEVAA